MSQVVLPPSAHTPGVFFVGREDEQHKYQELLMGDPPWMMFIIGIAGTGKTALLNRLAQQTPSDVPVIRFSFDNESLLTDTLRVMQQIAEEVASYCDQQRVQEFEFALQEGRKKILNVGQYINQTIAVEQGASARGVNATLRVADAIQDLRRQARELVAKAFYAQMETFTQDRLVLMFDTTELLTEPKYSEVGQWILQDLLPELHKRMRQKNHRCDAVIASRLPFSLRLIEEENAIFLALPRLEREEVDQYLLNAGMVDDELRRAVYEITHGHVLSVVIMGELWKEKPFTRETLSTIRKDFNERALIDFIQKRIMDDHLESPYRELTRYGALFRSFDLPLLQAVFCGESPGQDTWFPKRKASEVFERFTSYPYVEHLEYGHYTLNALLREVLAEEIRVQEPEKWQTYHQRAADFFLHMSPLPLEWYYHRLASGEEQGLDDWRKAVREARKSGARDRCRALLEVASDLTLHLSPVACAARAYEYGRYCYYGQLWDAALKSYEEALQLYRELGDYPNEARVSSVIGDLQRSRKDRKDLQAALTRYRQALALYEQLADPVGQAYVLHGIGDTQRLRDEPEAALQSYEQALILDQMIKDSATTLSNRAELYLVQGKYEQAEQLYQRALTIRERTLGPDHPDTAATLNNLAELYLIQGQYAQAEQFYQRALAVYERKLGPDHPDIVTNLNRLALLYYIQGKYEQAEPLYQRILNNREKILGTQHPETATILNSLALLRYKQGKYEQTESFLKRAVAIREQKLGFQHPDTATSLNSLALLYLSQGKYEQAKSLYLRALTIYERALSEEHLNTATTFNILNENSSDLEISYFDQVINLNDLGLLLQEKGDLAATHPFFDLILKILERSFTSQYPHTPDQQLAIQKVQDWLQAIIQDMDIAQTSQSKLARTTALSRAIGMLSEVPQQLNYFSQVGQLLIKRIIDRWREAVIREAGRAGKLAILTEVGSPYIFTSPVSGKQLIGRDDLFRQIITLWSVPAQRNSLLIYGHRRMGKTSLAQALKSRCNFGDDTLLVYLDISGIKIRREGNLYYEISERLWTSVQDKIGEPDRKRFTSTFARTLLRRFLERLHKVAENSRMILVLDEFELLHKWLGLEGTYQVIEYLRSQTQTFHWLTLALVGLNDLDDLGRSYRNPLLGWESIHVGFLDASQVAKVLANPPGDPDFPLDYTPEALTMIATLTNGQPYLVQVIGHRLVLYYNHTVFTRQKEHSGVFDTADVQAVIDDVKFYDRAAAYFKGIWGQVTSGLSGEMVLLKALAEHEDGMNESALRITAGLDENNFLQSLTALERHDILCRKDNRVHYTVPLMRRWVQDNCLQEAPPTSKKRSGAIQ